MTRLTCYNRWGKLLDYMFQWDSNREVHISGIMVDEDLTYEIHFCNRLMDRALAVLPEMISGNQFVVEIPAELLEEPDDINVYVYAENAETGEQFTVGDMRIPVYPRREPVDYELVPTEGIIDVANGFVLDRGKLYLAKNGSKIGEGIKVETGGIKPNYAQFYLEGGIPEGYIIGYVDYPTQYLYPLTTQNAPDDWGTETFYQIVSNVLSAVPSGTTYEANRYFRLRDTTTSDISLYHINCIQDGQILVNMGGRDYYNTGRGECYAAVFYEGTYSGILLFSTDPNAVTYYVSSGASASAIAFSYQINGQTWYHSDTPHWIYGDNRSTTRESPRGLLRYPYVYNVSTATQEQTEEVLRFMGAIE